MFFCKSASRKGVTLIELVMAMVILAVIAIATAVMIGAQIQGMAESSDLTAAGNAARLEMGKLHNTLYSSIVDGSSVDGFYTVSWIVTETGSGLLARKDITMTVKRAGSSAVLLTIYGSIANNITYAPAS